MRLISRQWGVAIATALMPPLCTAGFGLANGHWSYFLGAFYLFTINCVFIAFSSAIVIRAFHVRRKHYVDAKVAKRVRIYLTTVVLLTILPSLYLAYILVQEELFREKSVYFVNQELNFKQTHVIDTQINPKARRIEVTLIGDFLSPDKLATIIDRLPDAGLADARLVVHQADQRSIDVKALKTGLLSDLYAKSQGSLEKKDQIIHQLQTALAAHDDGQERLKAIPGELQVLFPQISEMWLADALDWSKSTGLKSEHIFVLNLAVPQALTPEESAKIEQWLKVRLNSAQVKLVVAAPAEGAVAAPVKKQAPPAENPRHGLGHGG